MLSVLCPEITIASAAESLPLASRSVTAVFRLWWKTYPPALRPMGSPAFRHAVTHEFRKSPMQPQRFDALRTGPQTVEEVGTPRALRALLEELLDDRPRRLIDRDDVRRVVLALIRGPREHAAFRIDPRPLRPRELPPPRPDHACDIDRKSTRLNSSHVR